MTIHHLKFIKEQHSKIRDECKHLFFIFVEQTINSSPASR